ncbi:dihydrodipicolinate reductase [Mangrovimicrobium sediminis]|uniref:Dihydrodipicolinate reductase n=1 Tax=Mangrovimicrobium sediminis TaxID=2562682 RepID=A0A4Z0LYT2_9GAMM|nr:dihydrodipicolinate reductase [Haliea sp. SAOS-164]TGD72502.1 dihydrodipicolinate reductase [Haliea sp. SAOS-164]
MGTTQQPLRVVQWATGNIGLRSMREVIRHPDMQLVGALTYNPDKAGRDAGELCGEAEAGVPMTTDREAIHALGADCVLYMPRVVDIDDLVRFAEAGTNIVSICMELYDGGSGLEPADRARLAEACARGGASVYGTGSSPGFITDIFPYALLSLQRQVDFYQIEEFGNMSRRDSPGMLFDQIGFGRPMDPDAYPTPRLSSAPTAFAPIARAAGWEIDEWRTVTGFAAARSDAWTICGDVKAGTVGARRLVKSGYMDGVERVRFAQVMYITTDLDPDWNVGETGWRVTLRGDASLEIDLKFPVSLDELGDYTPALTANPPVNAIPFVCAAPPGLLRTADLPPLVTAGPAAFAAQ